LALAEEPFVQVSLLDISRIELAEIVDSDDLEVVIHKALA
jgi:hypothetical protein